MLGRGGGAPPPSLRFLPLPNVRLVKYLKPPKNLGTPDGLDGDGGGREGISSSDPTDDGGA